MLEQRLMNVRSKSLKDRWLDSSLGLKLDSKKSPRTVSSSIESQVGSAYAQEPRRRQTTLQKSSKPRVLRSEKSQLRSSSPKDVQWISFNYQERPWRGNTGLRVTNPDLFLDCSLTEDTLSIPSTYSPHSRSHTESTLLNESPPPLPRRFTDPLHKHYYDPISQASKSRQHKQRWFTRFLDKVVNASSFI